MIGPPAVGAVEEAAGAVMAEAACYVYAVVPAGPGADPRPGTGLGGQPVRPVTAGRVAAICSRVDDRALRPSRANVLAHHSVVEEAHASGPVLPVRFGTVLPDEPAVVSHLLEPAETELAGLLEAVSDHDEFRVRARYRGDAALHDVMAGDHRIARYRDRMKTRPGGGTVGDRIHLGELVAAGLERLRALDAEAFGSCVGPALAAARDLGPREESDAFYWALLVARSEKARMDAAIAEWAGRGVHRLEVSVVGPLPPWDFAGHLGSGPAEGRGPWDF